MTDLRSFGEKKYLWLPNIFEAELSEKILSIKKGLESMGFGTKLDTTIGMLTASSIRGHYENVIKVEFIFPVGEDKRVLSALRNKVPPAGGVFITATPILPSRKKPYTTPPMTPIWRNIYRMILDLRGKDLSDTRDSRWDDPRFQK